MVTGEHDALAQLLDWNEFILHSAELLRIDSKGRRK